MGKHAPHSWGCEDTTTYWAGCDTTYDRTPGLQVKDRGSTAQDTSREDYLFLARCCCDLFMSQNQLFVDDLELMQTFEKETQQTPPLLDPWGWPLRLERMFFVDAETLYIFALSPVLFGYGIFARFRALVQCSC